MHKTMPVSGINLITFFVIEKRRYVFQSLCNCASHLAGSIALLRSNLQAGAAATAAAAAAAALINLGIPICCIYFSQAFSSQYVADIN